MKRVERVLKVLMVGFLLHVAGCGVEVEGYAGNVDNSPPLADLDVVWEGAPKHSELVRIERRKSDELFPARFTELRGAMSSVKSQGRRNVCSIFSTIGYMEHLYIVAGYREPDFSEQYLQWSTKFQVGAFLRTPNSNARVNLQAIHEFGLVEESQWPYEFYPWSDRHDPECGENFWEKPVRCYTNGFPPQKVVSTSKFKLPQGRYLHPLDIKIHIRDTQTAAVAGFQFFYQSWNHGASTLPTNRENWQQGIVLAPNEADRVASRREKGVGHSILIIGWDDDMEVQRVDGEGNPLVDEVGEPFMDKGFYLFKNSWGTDSFGVKNEYGPGYGWISQDYIHEFATVRVSSSPRPHNFPSDKEFCGDGIDNDDNGEIDCFDKACFNEEICRNSDLVFSRNQDVAIPDGDHRGVRTMIVVDADEGIAELVVEVDIKHIYIGDLQVLLRKGDTIVTLHNRAGGGAFNLQKSFELGEDFAGERDPRLLGAPGVRSRTQGCRLYKQLVSANPYALRV